VFRELCSLGVQINCSSLDQVQLLGEVAPGTTVSVRVNPGEGHGANKKVNTGGPASKHGIYFDQLDLVHDLVGRSKLNLVGIHAHIGSGTDLEHWLRIKDLVLAVARTIKTLRWVNLGGGLPVVYNTDTDNPMPLTQWGEEVSKAMVEFSTDLGRPIELQLEPGRFLVAESGYLIAEVQNIKRTPSYTFALVNSGLNHNIRPAMYGAYHPISFVPREDRPASKAQPYVIAGCLCESGDVFTVTEDEEPAPRMYPELRLGDLMVMGAVGAYSHSMKSDYNSIPFPASVLLTPTGEATILERRGTLDDIVRREVEAGV
jgi:diaminopimelate decarboxylase